MQVHSTVYTSLQALVLGFTVQDELAFPSLEQWNCPFFRYKLTNDMFSWIFKKLKPFRKNTIQDRQWTPVSFLYALCFLPKTFVRSCCDSAWPYWERMDFPALLSTAHHPLLCYCCVNTTKPAGGTGMPWARVVRQLLEQREQKAAQTMVGLLNKFLQASSKRTPPNFKGMLPASHLYNWGHHK